MEDRAGPELFKIAKTGLDSFAGALKKASYEVLAPVQDGEATRFGVLSDEEIQIPRLSTRPLKELFFPQDEPLLSFGCGGAEAMSVEASGVVASESISPRVVLGARPCDARSLVLLDNVFVSSEYRDPYYAVRREKTVIITFACLSPGAACFCESTGSGPYDETGSDILFMGLADSYVVKPVSERGKGLLKEVFPLSEDGFSGESCILHPVDGEDIQAAVDATRAEEKLAAFAGVPVEAAVAALQDVDAFDASTWEEIYRKCLGCAVCTYLCPTCHCFDIGDEIVGASGERVRNWDSCMFPLFTLHASGHNPRPSKKERFRQRVMHKFNYFVENNGCVACVGCGRCVEACPVNQDMRQILSVFASRGGGS
ncbi:MAG TPA: 4Fe-4S dicluster domain-containing protein [Bacillota bacterium]|nr:4Fe-4S dicluster domain-containing protein [Bacillota bacterium]